MRWLADEHVEPPVVAVLRGAGHDMIAVYEADAGLSDADVLARAADERRILLTYDKGFGDLVYRLGLASSGIVRVRLSTRDAGERAAHLRRVLTTIEQRAPGHFLVVSDSAIRVRVMPRTAI